MRRTLVLDVVGLTRDLIGEHTPNLSRLLDDGAYRPLHTVTPAVTCTAQSTFITGTLPQEHGCVANGWYFRDLAEVWFWRQSNRLVQGEKLWDAAKRRDQTFTCAKLFWWYNMYSSADWSVTPRPMYPADGRKVPDVYTYPMGLRDELTERLGQFPLFNFWGPTADIKSSRWIASSALEVDQRFTPTLSLVYLPHLDYNLQRLGPRHPDLASDLREVDAECGRLIDRARRGGMAVIVLSEYGITEVSDAVHINRALRSAGLIAVRRELGTERFDAGASDAFAVADHQLAHIYVRDRARIDEVAQLVRSLDGVEVVLGDEGKQACGLDHPRSGELVAISEADRWFSYYYWLDDELAPDYARTVDIHRKPGYDPVELFVDPNLPSAHLAVGTRLIKKKLGFRTLMDVIGLDTHLVRGSHGRPTDRPEEGPVFITSEPDTLSDCESVQATHVKGLILEHVFGA